MRNSIFKSYTKKILRSEAFVSVIIVFVLALGIIGTSYALYMDVDSETDYQLVEVGDLSVSFEAPDGVIKMENMLPMEDEDALASTENIFQFYIYNTGSYMIDYDINLVPVADTNTIEPQYINYQICRDNSENCSEVKTLGTVNEDDSVTVKNPIFSHSLSAKKENEQTNPSAYYFLRLWLNNKYNNESGGILQYKVEINTKNSNNNLTNDNTLAARLLNDSRVTLNDNKPSFTGIADYVETGNKDSGELGLFKAEDDYGISYYYRGAQSYNYVNFAGFIWRVVRINGDGSIRLILNGTLDKICVEYESDETTCKTYAGTTSVLNSLKGNAYIGYMYGLEVTDTENINQNRCLFLENDTVTDKITTYTDKNTCESAGGKWTTNSYEATHANVGSSTLKTNIDTFYETYIESDANNKHYAKYLADTLFCNDKSVANENIGSSNTALGFGKNKTYYASAERLIHSSGTTSITVAKPSLKCAEGKLDNYSRFTSSVETETTLSNGTSINNDLKYPIASISADEAVYAGAWKNSENQLFYLHDAHKDGLSNDNWRMLTPFYILTNGNTRTFSLNSTGSIIATAPGNFGLAVRPVINLKADVLYDSGNGTSISPYTIKYN